MKAVKTEQYAKVVLGVKRFPVETEKQYIERAQRFQQKTMNNPDPDDSRRHQLVNQFCDHHELDLHEQLERLVIQIMEHDTPCYSTAVDIFMIPDDDDGERLCDGAWLSGKVNPENTPLFADESLS